MASIASRQGIEVLKIDFGFVELASVKGHAGVDPLERCFQALELKRL